jgi:hypothetical protein
MMDDLSIIVALFSLLYVGIGGIWRDIGKMKERLTRMETLCFQSGEE